VLLTFACVLVGQVFFRAESVRSAFYVLGTLLGRHSGSTFALMADLPSRARFALGPSHAWLQISLALLVVWALPNTQQILGQVENDERTGLAAITFLRWRPNLAWGAGVAALTAVVLTMIYASTSFLYFQF
jgi:hypothetical protein